MIKKRVFIGSSTEALGIAQKVKGALENRNFEATIWNENLWDDSVFKINNNYFSDLLKATLKYDFGILIGTQDDKVEYRGNIVMLPRDNVIFELGLFLGRLGASKCAFLLEKDTNLLSDLKGLTLAFFDMNIDESITSAVGQIINMFESSSDIELNLFPSTTLATTYFENLIYPTCRYLIENSGLSKNESEKYENVKFIILIPSTIKNDINLQSHIVKSKYKTEKFTFDYIGRPRTINVEIQVEKNEVVIIDFPTTLTGINHVLSNMLPKDYSENTTDYFLILERELRRFVSTLELLINKNNLEGKVFLEYIELPD